MRRTAAIQVVPEDCRCEDSRMDDNKDTLSGVTCVTWEDKETGTRLSKAFARPESAEIEADWLKARGHLNVRVAPRDR
jgi:hypothetical protein